MFHAFVLGSHLGSSGVVQVFVNLTSDALVILLFLPSQDVL